MLAGRMSSGVRIKLLECIYTGMARDPDSGQQRKWCLKSIDLGGPWKIRRKDWKIEIVEKKGTDRIIYR